MENRSGLLPRATGIPENQTGGKSESTTALGWGVTGITVAGFFSFREMGDERGLWWWENKGELACEGIDKVLFLREGEQ
jgi:hypothetical protein